MKKIIYDLGAGDGENIPYYLLKADIVVAVEANPKLCQIIKKKFDKEISKKNLIVENIIITNEINNLNDVFYVHKHHILLGQYPKPENRINDFYTINIKSQDIISFIKKYGEAYYIKIDLENYDNKILEKILLSKIKFSYLSVEINDNKTISTLAEIENFNSYKIINGKKISKYYSNAIIEDKLKKKIKYSFLKNSAGPFGNDIKGHWMDKKNLLKVIDYANIGWNDLHVSVYDKAKENYYNIPECKFKNLVKFYLKNFLNKIFKISFC
jgi:FkbM family methyltransferase